MNTIIDEIIYKASMHKTMAGLAKELGLNVHKLKYILMKAHKLMLVKNIINLILMQTGTFQDGKMHLHFQIHPKN